MPKPSDSRLNSIVKHISRQIAEDIRKLRSEESAPRYSADQSDAYMKALRDRLTRLRALRLDAEDVFTGDMS